jgi:hypothetical protein
VSTAQARDRAGDLVLVPEMRGDEPVLVEPEMFVQVGRERRLAARREAGELALVPHHLKTAGDGGERVSIREAVADRRRQQPPVVAVVARQHAVPELSHAVADVVADAVRRVDERVVPLGKEQRRERV